MALTVWQPWAQLLATGAKSYETRGWPTSYRGPLAIHAGARWRADEAVLCWRSPFREALEADGFGPPPGVSPAIRRFPRFLPLAAVVAVAELVDVVPCWPRREGVGDLEIAFGDWGPGRYGFLMANPVLLPEPVPVIGRQGLFALSPSQRGAIDVQVREVARW